MEDGEGVQIDFKNTVLLLTSNAAQEVITDACERGAHPDPETLVKLLRPHLLKYFTPAFLGRLVIVPYYPLGDEQIRNIVRLKLEKLVRRFEQNHSAEFTFEEQVVQSIGDRCTEVDSGARNIDHILTHVILPQLAQQVLEHISLAQPFDRVSLGVDAAGGFTFSFFDKPMAAKS
jgi:type VI secretion system protein VasG